MEPDKEPWLGGLGTLICLGSLDVVGSWQLVLWGICSCAAPPES